MQALRPWVAPIFCIFAPLLSLGAAVPASYQLERVVTTVQVANGRKIDTKVWLNANGDILFSTSQGDSNLNPQYSFQSAGGDLEELPIPGEFEALLPADMNATGDVVGKAFRNLGDWDKYAEAGFIFTPSSGVELATKLNENQSALLFVEDDGRTAGTNRFGDGEFLPFVTTVAGEILQLSPPPGYPYFEVRGLSEANEVLLFAADDDADPPALRQLALTAPEQATNFLPINVKQTGAAPAAMNVTGDIATVVSDPDLAPPEIQLLPASNRINPPMSVSLAGVNGAIYNFAMNIRSEVILATEADGHSGQVVFATPLSSQVPRIFEGYRPFLNDNGEVIFGRENSLMYWDSRVPGTFPAAVPVGVPASQRAPEILALNGAGRVALSYFSTDDSQQTLAIFRPVAPTPTPTPTPVPAPPVPAPAPTPAPAPPAAPLLSPVEEQIILLEDRVIDVRQRVRNPVARANHLRNLNRTLQRLRQQAAREEQAGNSSSSSASTPLEQQIQSTETRIIEVRQRVRNPRARAEQLRQLNLTLRQLRQQEASQ